jgi:hypothetical protein
MDAAAIANQVIVRLPSNGVIELFNAVGSADVIVDVVGYYGDLSGTDDRGRFIALDPFRAIDTRVSSPFGLAAMPSGAIVRWGEEPETASGYVVNVTVTETSDDGYVVAFPFADGHAVPLASTLNYSSGMTVPNHAIVATGPFLGFYNFGGDVHLIVDFFGYFT